MTGNGGGGGDGDDFDRRLKAARAQYEAAHGSDRKRSPEERSRWQGIGYAMRVGSELIAALIVGVGIGYLLDEWLGTRPWLMALFLFIGGAAGVMNVYRLVEGKDAGIGWKRPDHDPGNEADDGKGG
ncbi:AtpZ/AtpI family protein [Marivibrio halodurans]|uniref:AtpZ/AtpI family protein n=1 Tax=Marivibrio halodurans TaxID=2039722 RepID=A0A8J7RXX2_9PROT|nr:AtpZ/AtpI family protein [Marivibrio halodurans]MBP5856595.1 AtpZ/AtpI family protein [Marivibrio halodurans]